MSRHRPRPYDVGIHQAPVEHPGWRIARVGCLTIAVVWTCLVAVGCVMVAVKTTDPKLKAPILALYREDGVVFADVLACGDDQLRSFYVDADNNARWSIMPDLNRPDAPKVTTVRLFEVPPGWSVYGHEPFLSRPSLEKDHGYLVWLRTVRDDQAAFAFLTADLDVTTPDIVLTVTDETNDNGDPLAAPLPRTEFERRAAAYCDKFP